MAYNLIKISGLPLVTPDSGQDIVVGVGDLAKRINYGDVKADMVGTSPSYTTDTEPYLMRKTARTGVVGKCALSKLVGGSLGWNQIIPKTAPTATNGGVTFTNNNDGSWTITGTTTGNNVAYNLNYQANTYNIAVGHAYYISGCDSTVRMQFVAQGSAAAVTAFGTTILKFNPTDATATWARLQINLSGTTVNKTYYPQGIDLTLMLGSTIADYVYSLETATAGAGIAKLKSWGIDLDTYHAYDAGSIQSVEATAHITKDADDNIIGNYPLGSDTLRGIPQLVNNELQYDGDVKTPDGTITRKYGYVDLGSLTWTKENTTAGYRFSASFSLHKKTTAGTVPNMICGRYPTVTANNTYSGIYGISNNGTYSSITVCDTSYSDATTFKTAMNGVYLVYELETETTESSTAFQKVQTIDADGTESFTTSTPVPVGHETQTPDNILAALGWLGE